MKIRHQAFTLIELLVVIAIIAILASLALPAMMGAMLKGQMAQTVNNGRQIQIAGLSMANDRTATGDPALGWPGDLTEATSAGGGGQTAKAVRSVSDYVDRLTEYDYLKKADVGKVFQAPGITPWTGTGKFDGNKNSAFKIYKTTDNDGATNLFLATKNYTYNKELKDADAKPYGDKGFVVVRKGGDAVSLKKQQAKSPVLVGLLPGKSDPQNPGAESNSDILSQN